MRRHLALSMTAALSACNLAPRFQQPVVPIPGAFATDVAGTREASDLGWREFFGDPRLKAHVAAALSNNRDLAQSVARVAQARAQYRIQDADRFPQVAVQAGASATRQPTNIPVFGNVPPGGGPDAISFEQYNLGVQVASFELDFWSRVRNLSEAQRHRYLATVEAERSFRISLIAQVAATYLDIRAGAERVVLAQRTLASRREVERIARRRLDAGVTSTADHDQAYLLARQAETELAELLRTTAQAENLLMLLTGGPEARDLPDPRPLADSGQFAGIAPGLPSSLLLNRPDVLRAEQDLRAANADIGAARAAFLPAITLTGLAGFLSPQLGELLTSGSTQYQASAAASVPTFDWGRRGAQLGLTKARADELVAAYQRTAQGAFREVSDALVARRRYAEQVEALIRAVEAHRRLAATSRKRYDNGIAIYLEVADAERNLFDAEQQLLGVRSAQLQNGVSLYVALGGGLNEGSEPPR